MTGRQVDSSREKWTPSARGPETNGHEPLSRAERSANGRPEAVAQLESLWDINRQGVLGINLQGRCTFLNRAAAKMLAVDPEDAVGRQVDWVVRQGESNGSAGWRQFPSDFVLANGEGGQVERGLLCRRDGTTFPAEYSFFPVVEQGMTQGLVMTFVNTLERGRLEEQFRQAQKMEAIGRLAGGIAHDFNNLLTAILGYSQLIRAGIPNSDPLYHEIVGINKAAQRAAGLTSQLLNFSRRKAVARQCVDLNALLADMEGMVRRLLGEDVELSLALDPSLACIQADPGQIEQVVLNLAVNARDAMPRGGKLTIVTANVALNGKKSKQARQNREQSEPESPPGPYVMLAAKDTGCGMDEETKLRIFEPFFTTKAAGQGTGLGLATVFGIVRENNGFIDVASSLGNGTTFSIYFPCLAEKPEAVKAVSRQPAARRGSETVLLVEDEDILRDLIQSILSRYGYHVLKATSAVEALRIGQRHPAPVHLLLTDLIMPQMTGQQLAEQLIRVRPEIKALFMSGSTDDTAARHGLRHRDIVLIRKPFTPTALIQRVRGLLDEAENMRDEG